MRQISDLIAWWVSGWDQRDKPTYCQNNALYVVYELSRNLEGGRREGENSHENEQSFSLYPGDARRHLSPEHTVPELRYKVTLT